MAKGKYSKEERLAIGKRIYEGEMNCYMAGKAYGVSDATAKNYFRMYKAEIGVAIAPRQRAVIAAARKEVKERERREMGKREREHWGKLLEALAEGIAARSGEKSNYQ